MLGFREHHVAPRFLQRLDRDRLVFRPQRLHRGIGQEAIGIDRMREGDLAQMRQFEIDPDLRTDAGFQFIVFHLAVEGVETDAGKVGHEGRVEHLVQAIEILDRRIVVAAVHGDAPPRAEMRALQPVVRRVAKQPRQARELIDDVVNETAFGMRGADRRAAPQPEHVPVNLFRTRQDDRVLHGAPPGMAIGPAVRSFQPSPASGTA